MGATNTAPDQKSGFFLCKSKATDPPKDSPNKYLIFSLFSCLSKFKKKIKNDMSGHTKCFKTLHTIIEIIKSHHIYL